jgi:predicted N-acetyltransferase YhbS
MSRPMTGEIRWRRNPAGSHTARVTTLALPGGLVLRTASPGDLDQIAALLTERGEPDDAVDHLLVMADPDAGWASCAVVVDGDRVVATLTLLAETLTLAGTPIPAGQVELVATDRDHEGRGLVRALMGWAHRRSAELGHLAQVLIGIPYFYRQFGYSYAMPIGALRPVVSSPEPVAGHTVRAATEADIPAMARLQDTVQAHADLSMPHSPGCWRWLVARGGSTHWLVERAGTPVATGRTDQDDDEVRLGEVAAVDTEAACALLAHALDLAGGPGGSVQVRERPDGMGGGFALAPFLGPPPDQATLHYGRIPDLVRLLEHLRPVLSARLAASEFADVDGEVIVSYFRGHVRFRYADGQVGPVTSGGTMQAPASVGGAGVAPDLLAPLLFGAHGIEGLARHHPDVYPGPNATLMRTLFPPVHSDLLTFYLP